MDVQVLKATANPAHAFSKFGSGNYETLRPRPEEGVDTRASLVSEGAGGNGGAGRAVKLDSDQLLFYVSLIV